MKNNRSKTARDWDSISHERLTKKWLTPQEEGLDGCAEVTIAQQRKNTPVFSGVLNYFPDAIMAVAEASYVGNEQHNPNTPLHWDRSKSGDELDALARHLVEAGKMDTDGIRHSAKVAWRALANLQKEIEKERA